MGKFKEFLKEQDLDEAITVTSNKIEKYFDILASSLNNVSLGDYKFGPKVRRHDYFSKTFGKTIGDRGYVFIKSFEKADSGLDAGLVISYSIKDDVVEIDKVGLFSLNRGDYVDPRMVAAKNTELGVKLKFVRSSAYKYGKASNTYEAYKTYDVPNSITKAKELFKYIQNKFNSAKGAKPEFYVDEYRVDSDNYDPNHITVTKDKTSNNSIGITKEHFYYDILKKLLNKGDVPLPREEPSGRAIYINRMKE